MTTTQHPLNRHLFIADNLNLLRSLDNESIDLICIDPPFAKNQTWVGSLKPPLSDAELRQELETLDSWGITTPEQAAAAGIEWPQGGNDARFKDIWRWENDVHEDWVQRIEQDYEALAKVMDSTYHTICGCNTRHSRPPTTTCRIFPPLPAAPRPPSPRLR